MDRNQLLNDAETAMRVALDGRQAQLWTTFPAIVTSVNLTQMTLECTPAIQGVVTHEDGTTSNVTLPKLVDVPINFPSAGGFILTFPVKSNDEILIHIASRCIDAWWQSGGIQPQAEFRMHDLSDGFAAPGVRSLPNVVPAISSTEVQLRNDAGTVYFSITPGGKLGLVNATKDMKGVLNGSLDLLIALETALNTFASATSAGPAALAAASAALVTALGTLTPAITAYKTSDVGALLK